MPHVEIKCYAGRSNDQKEKCAEEIADVIARILGCKTTSVSVAIKDIPEEDWKTEVWDKNGNTIREVVQLDRPQVMYFRVFNGEQVEGLETVYM